MKTVPPNNREHYNVKTGLLIAKQYYSGFELAHDTYSAISAASDGKIYYVLSSQSADTGGKVCCYDPISDQTQLLGDLTEICGEKQLGAIPQGKSHVDFFECNGRLFFATHVGVYEMIDGMERLPRNPANGLRLYPGGHILSYNLSTGKFFDHTTVPGGEGVLTMAMDIERGRIYGITWPRGNFFDYNIDENQFVNLGQISADGENGIPGSDYRVLCRSIVIDSRTGNVYYSTAEGDIFCYHPDSRLISKMEDVNLRIDYFGKYDTASPGSMGYNWRKIFWHPTEEVAYGVHGNSGYLFRFDPRQRTLEIIERITSQPSRRSGMFDQFSYGYLGFTLGPDKETIYYLTGGPVYIDGRRVNGAERISKGGARGLENLHLVTYHLPTGKYDDHGPVFYPDGSIPTYVNSIAIGTGGDIYMLARFKHQEKIIQDLVKVTAPF